MISYATYPRPSVRCIYRGKLRDHLILHTILLSIHTNFALGLLRGWTYSGLTDRTDTDRTDSDLTSSSSEASLESLTLPAGISSTQALMEGQILPSIRRGRDLLELQVARNLS
jgi:hypothetical protein